MLPVTDSKKVLVGASKSDAVLRSNILCDSIEFIVLKI